MRYLLILLMSCLSFCALGQEGRPHPREGEPMPPPPRRSMRHQESWGRGADVMMTMSRLKKEKPEVYGRLEALRKSDFKAFLKEVTPYLPPRSNDAKRMNDAFVAEKELVRKIHECKDEAARAKLVEELRALLKKNMDDMLKAAEQRLERMRLQIQLMKEDQEDMLKDRLEQLLNHKELPPPPPVEDEGRERGAGPGPAGK